MHVPALTFYGCRSRTPQVEFLGWGVRTPMTPTVAAPIVFCNSDADC